MSNIIDSIQLSGTTYQIQGSGGGGNPTVELTQAQYDALVTAGTVQADTYYIITDAEAGDLTNYYTKTETNTLLGGKADTATTYTKTEVDNAITAATSTKQDTLVSGTNIKTINNTSILGSGNIDIQGGGGGGKAVSGGTNISITTGETADTINCTLPISTDGSYNGKGIILGNGNGMFSKGAISIVGGDFVSASTDAHYSVGLGSRINLSNEAEFGCGKYSKTNRASSTFGDSGNTLFSVGNGTSTSARHNAFEIRQNGDIYITSGGTDIKLQDNLGGGGGVNVVQTTGTSTTDVMSQDAVTTQLSGYVTKNTEQTITGKKIFKNSDKPIEFKQNDNNSKVGFSIKNSAATNNEVAVFEFRPNTFTIDGVQHPLLYFGHYRNTNTANAGVPQTVIGFRQYDQLNAAAYHYLIPLPEKAKTPFSLTTSFKDYYAPMGFKNGSTMITADNTGVVDLSSELGGLKLKKLTQAEYDALASKDNSTLYVIVN